MACHCNGGNAGIICGGNSAQLQSRYDASAGGGGVSYDGGTSGLTYSCGGGSCSGGGGVWVGGVYYPTATEWAKSVWTTPIDFNTYSNVTTISCGGGITLGEQMTCNTKEKKYVTRWTLTVVDVSKGTRSNRLVLETDVFEDSNSSREKIFFKHASDINSALASYNTANKLELTVDDLSLQLLTKGSFEIQDDD